MKAAIYCRLSKEDEDKIGESESIQNQKSMLLQYALENGFDIYQIYSDETIPASTGTVRHSIRCCKPQANISLMWYWPKRNPVLPVTWSSWKSICTESSWSGASASSRGRPCGYQRYREQKIPPDQRLINEWYLEDLSTNVRSVLDHKRKEGLFIGSFARYGYCKDPNAKGKLIIDPEAAEVVRRIFSMALNGIGTHKIARILNDEKIPSPTAYKQLHGIHYRIALKNTNAALWSSPTVYQILHDQLISEIWCRESIKR